MDPIKNGVDRIRATKSYFIVFAVSILVHTHTHQPKSTHRYTFLHRSRIWLAINIWSSYDSTLSARRILANGGENILNMRVHHFYVTTSGAWVHSIEPGAPLSGRTCSGDEVGNHRVRATKSRFVIGTCPPILI